MIKCMTPHFDMPRSSLVDRPRPFANIVEIGGQCPVLNAQTLELPRRRRRTPPATGASNKKASRPWHCQSHPSALFPHR